MLDCFWMVLWKCSLTNSCSKISTEKICQPSTAASSRNGAIGWISMQGYGNLTKAVGIPCKAWKSIQCMESPPGVGWKSNQVLQNTWMEIQPSYSKIHNNNPQKLMSNMKVNVNCCNLMKVKVNCYNPKSLNDEMNVFFQSKWETLYSNIDRPSAAFMAGPSGGKRTRRTRCSYGTPKRTWCSPWCFSNFFCWSS